MTVVSNDDSPLNTNTITIGILKTSRPYSKFTNIITFIFPRQYQLSTTIAFQVLIVIVLLLRLEVEVQDQLIMTLCNTIENVGCSQPDTNDISYLHCER